MCTTPSISSAFFNPGVASNLRSNSSRLTWSPFSNGGIRFGCKSILDAIVAISHHYTLSPRPRPRLYHQILRRAGVNFSKTVLQIFVQLHLLLPHKTLFRQPPSRMQIEY